MFGKKKHVTVLQSYVPNLTYCIFSYSCEEKGTQWEISQSSACYSASLNTRLFVVYAEKIVTFIVIYYEVKRI